MKCYQCKKKVKIISITVCCENHHIEEIGTDSWNFPASCPPSKGGGRNYLEEINKAINELAPLYDELTTSDLQGICMAKAMKLTGWKKGDGVETYMSVCDSILEGIERRANDD